MFTESGRRAIDDLYLGLVIPVEAFVFFYRGFEWIKVHQKIGWDDVAKDLRTTRSNMNDLKKLANVETGIRHASSTGRKAQADVSTYGTWAAGLLDALEGARKRVEPKYRRRSSKRVAEIITAAVSTIPYP